MYFIGKPRDEHANAIAAEYAKRIGRYAECTMREVVAGRFPLFDKHASARKVLLDPAGRTMATPGFVALVSGAEQVGQELVFAVGGHDGLPPEWKGRADLLLSLSAMTFPHELARAMLLEQIYRHLQRLGATLTRGNRQRLRSSGTGHPISMIGAAACLTGGSREKLALQLTEWSADFPTARILHRH